MSNKIPTKKEDSFAVKLLNVLRKFSLAGVEVTASAAELNILDGVTATAAELNILDGVTANAAELNLNDKEAQTVSADGAISIKNGVVKITKAGVAALTLANPTDVTDDHKELLILSTTAHAHTVTLTGGFGNGGTGEDVATFSGVAGDNIRLKAYGGYWYNVGAHQVTVA